MFYKSLWHMRGLLCVLAFIATLAACAAPTPTPVATSTEAAKPVSETRVLKHSMGETTITGTPKRVIALEWTYVEDLLALGVQPVGVADIEGYNIWVKIPVALSKDAVDVGVRGEPNLETIARLKPDLIIGVDYSMGESYDKLSAIAPTMVFDPYPTDESISQYDEMRTTFLTIADVTGRSEEGKAAIKHMEDKFASLNTEVEQAGLKGQKFILSQMFAWENAVTVRLFTENGMATQIVEQLGLENAWDGGFQQYGFSEVSVEKLKDLEDVHFFYVVNDAEPVLTLDQVSSLWKSLPFVKANHAYPLGGDTWLFGGPLSAELIAEIVVNTLSK